MECRRQMTYEELYYKCKSLENKLIESDYAKIEAHMLSYKMRQAIE